MIVTTGESPLDTAETGQPEARLDPDMPEDWKAALANLVSARLGIIRIEAKSASSAAFGKLGLLLGGLFALLSAWVLALTALIGVITAASSWQWYHVAFAAAGAHLIIAVILLLFLKSGKKASFPVTRAEFVKDREWLNRLKNQ